LRKAGKLREQDIIDIARKCARLLDDKKAMDVVVLNLMPIHSYFDYFIISTGNSLIHGRALAREVQRFMHEAGIGERTAPRLDSAWIVLDYSEIVVHIFTHEMRDYYQLDRLWADAENIRYDDL
jgi:ribosome-associated protein